MFAWREFRCSRYTYHSICAWHTWAPCGHNWSCVISDWSKGAFFDILKPQTHVSLVKCTQPWSFNWSTGNFNWSAPLLQSVATGPYITIGTRVPTYVTVLFIQLVKYQQRRSKTYSIHTIHSYLCLGYVYEITQGNKESDITDIQTFYKNELAYIFPYY